VSTQVYVREVGRGGVCYADALVAVAPVWARGGCAWCALRAAAPPASAPAAAAAVGGKRAAEGGGERARKRGPAGGAAAASSDGGSSSSSSSGSGSGSSGSSDSSSDSDSDDSTSSGDAAPLPPPPRPRAGVAAAPAPPAAPAPLPRTLGRPLGCAPGCACPPGGAAPAAAAAAGPNPIFLRPPACGDDGAPASADDALMGYAVLMRAGGEAALLLDAAAGAGAPLRDCATLRCACTRGGGGGGNGGDGPAAAPAAPASSFPPCAAVFHLMPDGAAAAPAYIEAAAALRAAGAPLQLAARGPPHALCHMAAARVTARLHALSPRVFPLPPALAAAAAEAEEAAAEEEAPLLRRGRLLLRVCFRGGGQAPVCDAAACPEAPDVAALAAAALAARPALAPLAAALPAALRADAQAAPPAADALPPLQQQQPPAPAGNAAAAHALRAALLARRSPAAASAPAVPAPAAPAPSPPPLLLPCGDVIFLGTGCAEPSKHRGSAGLLLRQPGAGCLLFDCGEGASGALRRALGAAPAAAALAALRCVLISHRHADHLAGLPGVLWAAHAAAQQAQAAAAAPLPPPPPLVIGPAAAGAWLSALPRAAAPPWLAFVPAAALARPRPGAPPPPPLPPAARGALAAFGLTRVEAVPVEHCADAHGFVAGHACGWSLAFSGDCRPSAAFAAASAGAALLVHEATFDDAHAAHARAKRHCTTGEALRVAATARAGHTVLTHFSARGPPAAALDAAAAPRTSLAFDGMRLTWQQVRAGRRARVCVRSFVAADAARACAQLPHAAALVPLVAAMLAPAEGEEADAEAEEERGGGGGAAAA
jgi:ribonuclease BN (tRNA processing enzyme)